MQVKLEVGRRGRARESRWQLRTHPPRLRRADLGVVMMEHGGSYPGDEIILQLLLYKLVGGYPSLLSSNAIPFSH